MPKIHYNVEDTYLAKPEGFREMKDLKEQKREKNNIKHFPKYYDPEEGFGSFGQTIGAQKDQVSEATPKDTQKRKDISGPSTVSGSAKKKNTASKSDTKYSDH